MNFVIILQRLKAKKYGPGRNIIKEEILQQHILRVFSYCEEHFGHDEESLRISHILRDFFEYQLNNCPNPKSVPIKKSK